MRILVPTVLALLAGAGIARAQSGTDTVVPPAPPIVATPINPTVVTPQPPLAAPPAGLVQSQPPPGESDVLPGSDGTAPPPDNSNSGLAAPAPDAGSATSAAPAPPADSWLPGSTAQIGVLDEVDGSVAQVQIPVGGQAQIGDLQVSVQSCLRRPPDQIPDAAAYLTAQPTSPPAAAASDTTQPPTGGTSVDQDAPGQANLTAAGYRGWMLRSAPGAAVVGDASESLRLIDCQ